METNIHKKMVAIMAGIGAIPKAQINSHQKYRFRGIDQIMNALHPLLVEHKVYIVPRVKSFIHTTKEVVNKHGDNVINSYSSLEMEFDFVSDDGSKITLGPIPSEGLDQSDKATNKALAAALKYGLTQAFMIPTEDMIDGDSESPKHEVGVKSHPEKEEIRQVSNSTTSNKWDHSAAKAGPVYNGNPVARVLKTCEKAGWDKKDAGKLAKEKFGDWQFSKLLPSQVDWLCNTISTLTADDAFEALRVETKDALRTNPPSAMFDENNPPPMTEEDIPF